MPDQSLVKLLEFLDARVFTPTLATDPLNYSDPSDRKLLKSVQQRVQQTRVRYMADYETARDVKVNFTQDLNSTAGQALASDMLSLHLTRFENIQAEFVALCKQLGV